MALTEEQKRKALEDMKKNQKDINKSKQEDNKQSADDIIAKQQKTIESLKERLGESEKNSKNLKNENTHLKSEVDAKVDSKTQMQQEKALNDVIESSNGKYFAKKYKFETEGKKPYKFFIKMHYPTVFEQGAIEQEFASLTNGYGYQFSDELILVFKAIAYLRVVGDECPEELKDPDKLYRTDILVQVFSDYAEWADTFRQKQKY